VREAGAWRTQAPAGGVCARSKAICLRNLLPRGSRLLG